MVGMLNCSPAIFTLYEVNLLRSTPPTPRGAELIASRPELKPIFGSSALFTEVYNSLSENLANQGYKYAFLGDKILSTSLSLEEFESLGEQRMIFMIRDLRTWLCKNVVVDCYGLENGDITQAAIAYLDRFIASFAFPRCLRVRMEDLIYHNDDVIHSLEGFLEMKLASDLKNWWKKNGRYEVSDPKAAVVWWKGHDSSRLKPKKLDTNAKLKDHPFWNQILPIFDRYYSAIGSSDLPAPRQIEADRKAIAGLAKLAPVKLTDIYAEVSSVSFGEGIFGGLGHRSKNVHTKPFSIRKDSSK